MITAAIVTVAVVGGLGYALGSDRRNSLILRHPYNNRHNDASGAREDHI